MNCTDFSQHTTGFCCWLKTTDLWELFNRQIYWKTQFFDYYVLFWIVCFFFFGVSDLSTIYFFSFTALSSVFDMQLYYTITLNRWRYMYVIPKITSHSHELLNESSEQRRNNNRTHTHARILYRADFCKQFTLHFPQFSSVEKEEL